MNPNWPVWADEHLVNNVNGINCIDKALDWLFLWAVHLVVHEDAVDRSVKGEKSRPGSRHFWDT